MIKERKMHNFTGVVIACSQARDFRNKEDTYKLEIEGNKLLQQIIVYQRKVGDDIWNQIVNGQYLNKKYFFICEKIVTNYHLKDWKEIK